VSHFVREGLPQQGGEESVPVVQGGVPKAKAAAADEIM
jgi:hypothetical protein